MKYTVKEVSMKTNLSSHTIRYYEKEGLLPFVKRDKSGNREFSDQDLEWISLIDCLKNTGMPLKNIKQYINWYIEGISTFDMRRDLLIQHRLNVLSQLEELKHNLDKIDKKITYYDNTNEIHPELKR
ncbi:MAG: MerR family transcriptional regulator [Peptostreptococcaceae bacterium]